MLLLRNGSRHSRLGPDAVGEDNNVPAVRADLADHDAANPQSTDSHVAESAFYTDSVGMLPR
jgi:hypothetical protein